MARRTEPEEGPIIMVCTTGIHCCGTFIALNILIDRIIYEKRVNF